MEPFVQKLKDDLDRFCRQLMTGNFFSFSAEEMHQLQSEGQAFLYRIDTLQTGFLTVGLIGGTGVGKSTLMNALAEKEIAAANDRRPHTDRILIYRHETVQPEPMTGLDGIPRQVIAHTSEAIRSIILCDLPDFDSIVAEHRQHVLGFLEHLDILVWVTSIEKYADGRFYEFLKAVPKAAANFYFVLNKVDQCFDRGSSVSGYDALERVLKTFQKHIEENGFNNPLLFSVSAKAAIEDTTIRPWNQFRHLHRELFQQRDLKAVTAVKAANLDVEIRQYLSSLEKERQNLITFERILDAVCKEISERRAEWLETGKTAIAHFIEQRLTQMMIHRQGDISSLSGAGYGIGLLFDAWSRRFDTAGGNTTESSADDLSRDMAALFKPRLEWLTERLRRQRVYQSLPKSFEAKIHQAIAADTLRDDMVDRFRQVFDYYLSEPKAAFRLFAAGQRLTYAMVFLLFLAAIGGETAWRQLVETPGWQSIFHLMISMFYTLFSETGLAALGSLILINLFLGFRFFHRFRKRRKKEAQKILDASAAAAASAWEETLDALTGRIDGLQKDIQTRLRDLSGS